MNHSPSEGRGVEAAVRGHQNCLAQVSISSTATNREHTCAVNSIVSGCFLLGTCPWRPAAGLGPPCILWHSCKMQQDTWDSQSRRKEAEFPPYPHRLFPQPSTGADIQSLHWIKDNWQVFPRWEHLMVTPAAVRMRVTAFSFLACSREGSQTHWTGAGFPPLASGWQNFPNSFVQIPKRKDPTQGEGERLFHRNETPCKVDHGHASLPPLLSYLKPTKHLFFALEAGSFRLILHC